MLCPLVKSFPLFLGCVHTFPLMYLQQPDMDEACLVGWGTAMYSFARTARPSGPTYASLLMSLDLASSVPHSVLTSWSSSPAFSVHYNPDMVILSTSFCTEAQLCAALCAELSLYSHEVSRTTVEAPWLPSHKGKWPGSLARWSPSPGWPDHRPSWPSSLSVRSWAEWRACILLLEVAVVWSSVMGLRGGGAGSPFPP